MFPGGLDSLAGAVEEAVPDKRRVMRVNHRPAPKLNNVHKRLEALPAAKAGNFAPAHFLPVCAQVVGSRATRTTHPKVLEDCGKLMGLVSPNSFTVENPFRWNTKPEVIEQIVSFPPLRAVCSSHAFKLGWIVTRRRRCVLQMSGLTTMTECSNRISDSLIVFASDPRNPAKERTAKNRCTSGSAQPSKNFFTRAGEWTPFSTGVSVGKSTANAGLPTW